MLFYVILVIFFFLSTFLTTRLKNRSRFIYYTFFLSIITCIAIFRNNIGLDYYEYQKLYEIVKFDVFNIEVDPFFSLISVILRDLGFKSQMMFAVYALLTIMFIYKGCVYYSERKYDVAILFVIVYCLNDLFWFGSFNLIRQMLAVSIVFYSSKFIFTKEMAKFCIWILVASLCHYSAIIGLTLWLINKIKLKKYTWIIIIVSILILSETGFFMDLLENIHILLGNRLGDYELYFTKAYVRNSFLQGGTGLGVLLNLSVYLSLAIVADRKDKMQNFSLNCLFIGIIIWIAFNNITPMLRMRLYFWIFTPLIFAFNFNYYLSKKNIILIYSILVMGLLNLYDTNLISDFKNNQYIVHNTNINIEYEFTMDFMK